MHTDSVTIFEIMCETVNLISIGLTGEEKSAHNCQSKEGFDAHAIVR